MCRNFEVVLILRWSLSEVSLYIYIYIVCQITVKSTYIMVHVYKKRHIREYGSTPYVGMTRFFSFSPYIGIGAKSRNRPKINKTRLCIAKCTIYIL